MDNVMLTKEMLRDFYKNSAEGDTPRLGMCPFFDEYTENTYHECCMVLFPRWAKKTTITKDNRVEGGCPCFVLSVLYVVRKTREFHRKNK